jgi:hypothetical protein
VTPRELLNAIRYRAYAMVFASGGKVSFEAAKKAATREITSEERARKRVALSSATTSDGITVRNAKATLLAKLAEISKRLKATAGLEASARSTPRIRKHTFDPAGTRPRVPPNASPTRKGVGDVKQSEPEQPNAEPQLIGGVFATTPTATRIDDSEFAPSLRWGDTATDNWRKSIELNERINRERQERSKWVG